MAASGDIARERRGSALAGTFAELYDETYERIYAYAYRHTGNRADAEDVTGAIFESAYRAYPRFQHQGRPVLAWLYTIAARRVSDFYRRRRPATGLHVVGEQADASPGPAERAERAWELAELHGALERLGPSDRQVIDLHYFAGLTHREVADLLGITVNAATVRLHRALKRLGQEMGVGLHA